jgi:hypothetical protein
LNQAAKRIASRNTKAGCPIDLEMRQFNELIPGIEKVFFSKTPTHSRRSEFGNLRVGIGQNKTRDSLSALKAYDLMADNTNKENYFMAG